METKNIKLTDNEIIKALECCKMPVGSGACNNCPLKDIRNKRQIGDKSCTTILLENALDLNNRQKARIEALQMDNKQLETDNFNANMNCEHLQAEIKRLKAEVERLYKENDRLSQCVLYHDGQIVDAVKEFAHKIESYKTGIFIKGEELIILPLCDFEDIKSEMVGEQNV